MKKTITKIVCLLLVLSIVLGLAACGGPKKAWIGGYAENGDKLNVTRDENGNTFVQLGEDVKVEDPVPDSQEESAQAPSFHVAPKGEYNKGVVLVKFEDGFSASALGELAYTAADVLYDGSQWYAVTLEDEEKTEEAVDYLTSLGTLEKVDYDYLMGVTADVTSVNVSDNPHYGKHYHHHAHKIPEGWDHAHKNGKHPGGSSDVVVAVIDTGVDYNHLDLRNNIWVNTAEIANNGKDDDGNGYIDDIHGWDCVGNDKDPMDDNGHGTHVAGIIAAENNKIGGVGIAYNCKVMVLKAGNSSGYFNNSDIAEAVQYAYMNGASVINMSFGGSNISIAVEEALENAYNSCVLVAAAGNDGACNNLGCKTCEKVGVCYPAALPYVIGVMSTNADGTTVSGFSNYDHTPYNSVEYEVYAVGEGIPSTWPGNKYADLNGTSMAAPTVSGIAALLRSYLSDREVYSTKYIQSQIVNTGTVNPYNYILQDADDAHSVANVYEAMTRIPKPEVNLYDYSIDDSTAISAANNGNGVVDAGETVRLFVSLHNRGGVATNVNVSIDTYRGEIGNEALTDPYFTFVNPTMALSDIGTYSVRESGDQYFEIVVSGDCPNDYLADLNIRFTYENGLDEEDHTVYEDDGRQKAQFTVSRGFHLPATITEDTVYKADKLYIVGEDVVIPEGVTVTFEEGCEIQFYDDREYYNSPVITVYGTLNMEGTKDNMVNIHPSDRLYCYVCGIRNEGILNINYVDAINLIAGSATSTAETYVQNSRLITSLRREGSTRKLSYVDHGALMDNGHSRFVFGHAYDSNARYYTNEYKNNYICVDASISHFGGSLYKDNVLRVDSKIATHFRCETFTGNLVYVGNYANNTQSSDIKIYGQASENYFVAVNDSLHDLISIEIGNKIASVNNRFSSVYQLHATQVISGYYDSTGTPTFDINGSCSDISKLWPYVVSVEMFDKDGNAITTVGREEVKVRVTFNRPMDKNAGTFLTFGTVEPYADYRIDGAFVSDTVWEGTYTLKAQIENGQNFLKVNKAWAAEDPIKTVFGEYQLHEFTVDTTAAMAMNLQAVAKDEGIELTFAQDDYDTLLGYNIYRSESKDGNYVKLNPAILLPEENTFLDDNAEPGKTYWYTYTVVLSDFTESNPAGKVMATAKDTMAPSLYHTPVNQGYENNNLVISCTASDNVAIRKVTLYYRTVGATAWKALEMAKQNDKYNATIFGSDVTLAGIEYYIVAEDTNNAVQKGSADLPYTVVVKSADSLLGKGDVDGNGTVTTKDALMMMQCINGDLLLSDDQFKRADLNKDGVLSSVEALRILQYVNGKITTLEM